MFARMLACSALAAVLSAAIAPAARADFSLVSQDLTIDRQAQSAEFSLTFNQTPDFYTVGSDGIPVDSFQVEFNGQASATTSLPTDLTAVIRGDEIHVANGLRVRSPQGNGGTNSGGWGPVVGTVPFSLTGKTVSFTVPAEDLGWTGGKWQANIFSLADGTLTAQQTATSIPAPPAFWGGLAGLVGVVGLTAYRSAARRRTGRVYFAG